MPANALYETLFVARQPVLDNSLATWGYYHYYRRCQEHTYSEFTDPLQATLSVIQCLPACMDTCASENRAIVHLPPQALITGIPKALGPACVVPLVDYIPAPEPELLAALAALRGEGYQLALDLPRPFDLESPLIDAAEIIVLDMRAPGPFMREIGAAAKSLLARGKRLVAKRVETHEAREMAKSLGFSLYAGHFFREPVTLAQRKVSAAESTRLALFALLGRAEPPVDQLVAAIESDASVSYRVLTLINSPHFGMTRKVASIRQAVVLAGWKQLSSWLRVMILSDATPSTKARELLHLSAQRAKFFELLALASDRRHEAESLFLLGLLSLLPAMLDMPMQELIAHIPLEDALADALCGKPGHFQAWLGMAQSIEDTRWDDMAQYALDLGLPAGSVATAYNSSFQWADTVMRAMPHSAHGNGHSGGA